MITQIQSEYNDIIKEIIILSNTQNKEKKVFTARIYFKDTSQLAVRDIAIYLNKHSVKRKYAYQWMDTNNQLIIRWDNAEHHPHIENAPYHKHIDKDENVKPAPEVTLREVLNIIRSAIDQTMNS